MSSSKTDYEEILRAAKERADIVAKYDLGREEGAQIDPWEDPSFEVYHVTDRYGFIHDSALPKNVDAAEEKAKELETQRTGKWVKMTKSWSTYSGGEKLIRRIYKGIPDRLRGDIWGKLLNIPKVMAEQEGVYKTMRNRARTKSTSIRQIDLDVNRTYRNHIMFRERYGVKQQALFHVLAAYSVYNTEVGYCQGMSEIAALLLMYLNEEEAFWGLSELFISPKHTMHGFFMHGFPKLLRFQEHQDTVLKKCLPKIRKHMERNEMYPALYTIKWFLQCFLDRTPFHLTLRLWDIFMLEGDPVLVTMAYCVIKLHRRRIMKMQMDDLLTFFQGDLEKDFVYDDDVVIEQLKICMEELRKARLIVPPKSKTNEAPTLPFGLEIQPSVEQLIGRRTEDTVDEHFRKNTRKSSSGGKAAYLRRRNASGSGGNLLSTPDLSASRGGDSYSLHSRVSQYSIDDKSSYYDTATNSRLSLADFRTSAPSSRTSFGEPSEMGSLPALPLVDVDVGPGFDGTCVDLDLDAVEVEVTTPTTPTNPPLTPPAHDRAEYYHQHHQANSTVNDHHQAPSSHSDAMSQSFHETTSTSSSSRSAPNNTAMRSSVSYEIPVKHERTPAFVPSHGYDNHHIAHSSASSGGGLPPPNPSSSSSSSYRREENQHRISSSSTSTPTRSSYNHRSSAGGDSLEYYNASSGSHSVELTPRTSPRRTGPQVFQYQDQEITTRFSAHPTSSSRSSSEYRRPSPPSSIPVTTTVTTTNQNSSRSPVGGVWQKNKGEKGSPDSDYDNMNGLYDTDLYPPVSTTSFQRQDGVTVIPISRSDGFVSQEAQQVVLNGHSSNNQQQLAFHMKVARTENDLQRAAAMLDESINDNKRSGNGSSFGVVDQQRNGGIQAERQTSYHHNQRSEASSSSVVQQTQSSLYNRRVVEKTAYL